MASYKVSNLSVKATNTKRGAIASWGVTAAVKSKVREYRYRWDYYDPKAKKWVSGSESTTKNTDCTFTVPDSGTKVRVTVTIVSKTHTVKETKTTGKGKNKKTTTTSKEVAYLSPCPAVTTDGVYLANVKKDNEAESVAKKNAYSAGVKNKSIADDEGELAGRYMAQARAYESTDAAKAQKAYESAYAQCCSSSDHYAAAIDYLTDAGTYSGKQGSASSLKSQCTTSKASADSAASECQGALDDLPLKIYHDAAAKTANANGASYVKEAAAKRAMKAYADAAADERTAKAEYEKASSAFSAAKQHLTSTGTQRAEDEAAYDARKSAADSAASACATRASSDDASYAAAKALDEAKSAKPSAPTISVARSGDNVTVTLAADASACWADAISIERKASFNESSTKADETSWAVVATVAKSTGSGKTYSGTWTD